MGHIGKKCILCNIGKLRAVQCILKYFLLLHLIANLIIHPAAPKHYLGDMLLTSRIYYAKLKILYILIFMNSIIDIIRLII